MLLYYEKTILVNNTASYVQTTAIRGIHYDRSHARTVAITR